MRHDSFKIWTNTSCWTNVTLRQTYSCVRPNPYFSASIMREFHLYDAPMKISTTSMKIYTYLQNKRMRRCGVPPPPPIIFERLKLPQQIIYRRKENLSESPNHQKYWENILVSRFYEQFSRNRQNLGHFRKFEKISNS